MNIQLFSHKRLLFHQFWSSRAVTRGVTRGLVRGVSRGFSGCAAEGRGGCGVVALEGRDEVRGVGEAAEARDVGHGEVGRHDYAVRKVEAAQYEPPVRREAEASAEAALEGRHRDVAPVGELLEREVLGYGSHHHLLHALVVGVGDVARGYIVGLEVNNHLLEDAIGVGGVPYDMLSALEDVEAVLGYRVALAPREYGAVTMKDVPHGVVLCSDGECRLRGVAYVLK